MSERDGPPVPGVGGEPPGVVLVLSENWTMTAPRDLRGLVAIAVAAEAAGVQSVMLSEHVVLGRSAMANGPPQNPRDYAAPGNQDPATPWPDSLLMAAAIASATTRIRVALAAVIAPLRHPLLLAKQLATLDLLCEGRLVVQPTVSWHQPEYAALGVPFHERGAILEEQLAAMHAAWGPGPASFDGRFFAFDEVWCEPGPWRAPGPRLWFGGSSLHGAIVRRLVRYGSGLHPFGSPTAEELDTLHAALRAAGRDPSAVEQIGGIRGRFDAPDRPASLNEALGAVPAQLAAGSTSICFKPSMFSDDPADVPALCRRVLAAVQAAAG